MHLRSRWRDSTIGTIAYYLAARLKIVGAKLDNYLPPRGKDEGKVRMTGEQYAAMMLTKSEGK